ncbi:MAG: hypothetical protein AB7I27_13680 [Bacteriovoracaceae bacterium]
MNIVFILITLTTFSAQAKGLPSIDVMKLFDRGRVVADAHVITQKLGHNCATDPSLPEAFYREFSRAISGVARVATESTQLMVYKEDFPNICHVMTQNHLNSYTEGTNTTHSRPCVMRDWRGKCLARNNNTYKRPQPSYYWPKYFIEVTEKGNDPHSKFAKNNLLYLANRKIAEVLSKFMDSEGAIKLTALVYPKESGLTEATFLTPFEKLRIRGNKDKTNKSYDVNIWPVSMSELFAKHFSVCGPILEQQGRDVGGYSWAFKGVPMTCPVATTVDSYPFWDTGMIDYLDPEAMTSMMASSNPLTCGIAQGGAYLSNLSGGKTQGVGDKTETNKAISQQNGLMGKSLSSCSFPILGTAHAIAKQSLSHTDSSKWKQLKCTLWGSVAPRMSTSVYESDYSYANTALKFKLLAHDLFSLPRGPEERWTLAYPWESDSKFLPDAFSNYTSELSGFLKSKNIKADIGDSGGRSYSLYTPGSPFLMDSSTNPKYMADRVQQFAKEAATLAILNPVVELARQAKAQSTGSNEVGGDRRIYTIFEKISCVHPSTLVTVKTPLGVSTTKYDSCITAIQYEVYKYIQTKYLRKICDAFKQTEGQPWK